MMVFRNGCLLLTWSALCFIYTTAQTGNEKIDKRIEDIFKGFEISTISPKVPSTVTQGADDCECVPYYLCNGTHINTNGEGIIDIRENAGECESYLDICCKLSERVQEQIKPVIVEKHPQGCGWRNPDGVAFRTNGDVNGEAKFGEFPWMVAILYEVQMSQKILSHYKCGGSLIHPQAAITAAHCVSNRDNNYVVRAGEWDTQTTRELLPHQNRNVKSVTIHKQYYAGALYNDIALLILESPFQLADHIDVACLPPPGSTIPSGTMCWASGWGKNVFGAEGKYQVILKNIDLPFVERLSCQNSLRETRLGKHFILHESFVCAGGVKGKDTCQGDGGSPLVCPIPGQTNRYQQVGTVAWGIGCGEDGVPGVYGNVIHLRQWIDQEMSKNNLDITQYQY